jgi:GNAT superfamily N-acetyltransferase
MIALSELDTRRFGYTVAKATLAPDSDVAELIPWCEQRGVVLLVARVPVGDTSSVQWLEQRGAFLADVLVHYVRTVDAPPPAPVGPQGLGVRSATPADVARITAVSRACFTGYAGHYHADPRLDRALCDEVYVDWARRACSGEADAADVLVGELDSRIVGFAVLSLPSGTEADGSLFGVEPTHQRRGIFRALLRASLVWAASRGRSRFLYSTQLSNLAVQGVLVREGFEPQKAFVTLHKWFASPNPE